MCGPTDMNDHRSTTTAEMMKDADANLPPTETKVSKQQLVLRRGVRFGTISLALVVLAGSLTMGHYQGQRDELGCDSVCVGSMTSARSVLALVGSTLIGKASDSKILDKFGGARRMCLFLGVVASAVGVAASFMASSIRGLWISMVPSALMQQNFNVLKALFGEYHDSSSSASERAGSVGMLGMAAGLAFMVGPLAGTKLLKTYQNASIAALVCLGIAFAAILLLPSPPNNSQPKEVNKELKDKPVKRSFLPDLVPAARTPAAFFIMTARMCMGLAFHIFQTIWTVALKTKFNFGPDDYGKFFGFIGLSFAISQGFVAKYLLKQLGKTHKGRTNLLLVCALILGGGRLLVYQTSSINVVYGLYGVIIMALGVVNTIFAADTSQIADPEDLGGLFGILGSVESMAGIIGPVVGGFLAKLPMEQAPLYAVVFLYGTVFAMVFFGYGSVVGAQTEARKEKQKKDL
jgi:MFS transporter, DHA1 family, tetracycline resistance protein